MAPRMLSWIATLVMIAGALGACSAATGNAEFNLTPRQFKAMLDAHPKDPGVVLLDIRTPGEFKQGHIAGARLVDYYAADFTKRLEAFERNNTYLIYCRSGNRSAKSFPIFRKLGFSRVYHLETGIVGWVKERYPLTR